MADYFCRLYACRERRRYAHLGAFRARLHWCLSFEASLDAVSWLPFVVDELISPGMAGRTLPSLGWVRVFRVFHLFRTSRWAGAVRTCARVLFVNREILFTSLSLVSLTILLTSTLLYASCATESCAAEHGITDLPSAMYVATMMLTGQASPEGVLGPYLRSTVILTAFLSVPFFAVPAAMLTWGFEGEAQRLASREQRRRRRRETYGDQVSLVLSSSSSDDEYLEVVGGGDDSDEEGKDAAAERALAFFVEASRGAEASSEGSAARTPLLFRAQQLAASLQRGQQKASRTRQRRRDALELLEKVTSEFQSGLSNDQAEAIDERLRVFAFAVGKEERLRGATGDAGEPKPAGAPLYDERLRAVEREVATLQRTTAAGIAELKQLLEGLAARLPAK